MECFVIFVLAWCCCNATESKPHNVIHNIKKLLQIILIGVLILSCNNKNKTFEEAEMVLKNYSEEERIKEFQYLKTNVFKEHENLNNGFDSESIYYFSESDFEIVLDRVEKNGIAIFGIEPWLNGDFYDVLSFEDYKTAANDPKWYRKAFAEFKSREKNLMYSASYQVPKKLLTE